MKILCRVHQDANGADFSEVSTTATPPPARTHVHQLVFRDGGWYRPFHHFERGRALISLNSVSFLRWKTRKCEQRWTVPMTEWTEPPSDGRHSGPVIRAWCVENTSFSATGLLHSGILQRHSGPRIPDSHRRSRNSDLRFCCSLLEQRRDGSRLQVRSCELRRPNPIPSRCHPLWDSRIATI